MRRRIYQEKIGNLKVKIYYKANPNDSSDKKYLILLFKKKYILATILKYKLVYGKNLLIERTNSAGRTNRGLHGSPWTQWVYSSMYDFDLMKIVLDLIEEYNALENERTKVIKGIKKEVKEKIEDKNDILI